VAQAGLRDLTRRFRDICDDGASRYKREQEESLHMEDGKLDEKIIKKKSIPAQIVFWLVVVVLLYAFYKAFSGHPH
jgi:hypothetical protein